MFPRGPKRSEHPRPRTPARGWSHEEEQAPSRSCRPRAQPLSGGGDSTAHTRDDPRPRLPPPPRSRTRSRRGAPLLSDLPPPNASRLRGARGTPAAAPAALSPASRAGASGWATSLSRTRQGQARRGPATWPGARGSGPRRAVRSGPGAGWSRGRAGPQCARSRRRGGPGVRGPGPARTRRGSYLPISS